MSIELAGITKTYGGTAVVRDVSLTVADGEFFVLLGPSGSGKSTLLRIIAGLVVPDGGRMRLHGRDVTDAPPQKRGAGFVFQSYALFRHMSVGENVEFPLRVRGVRAAERRRRRDELLELVDLGGFAGRRPDQLSGGQQQRVALARALAHRPEVLLLDEPFGALDARIRTDLRRTIRSIQRELSVTAIFVTHDQEEAFELADRLAVLDAGRVLETGSPRELYLHPRTEFVASFLGSANLMVGSTTERGVRLGPVEFPLNGENDRPQASQRVQVLFRPEDVAVKDEPEALGWPLLGRGTVESTSFVGTFERLRVRLPALPGVRAIAPPVPFGSGSILVEAVRSQHQARRFPLHPGDPTWVGVRRFHALPHPGMRFVAADDGGAHAALGVEAARELARVAQARLEVVGYGPRAVDEDARLGDAVARESGERPFDLLVVGASPARAPSKVGAALRAGASHVLAVPGPAVLPSRVLLSVARGEPGKVDAAFTGRLCRHLSADITVTTVLPPMPADHPEVRATERYLAAAARTLQSAGCRATTRLRFGAVLDQVRREMAEGRHDLLVLGAPLALDAPDRAPVGGLVGRLLEEASTPVLIVRAEATA
jgi:sulfate transport system ATP-binding protein